MLLVDDDSAERLERHPFGQQCVGADEDVDATILECRVQLGAFGRRRSVGQQCHLQWPVFKQRS